MKLWGHHVEIVVEGLPHFHEIRVHDVLDVDRGEISKLRKYLVQFLRHDKYPMFGKEMEQMLLELYRLAKYKISYQSNECCLNRNDTI